MFILLLFSIIFVSYLLVGLIICAFMWIYYKNSIKIKVKKPIKLIKIKKLIYSSISNEEFKTLCKIKFNLPRLKLQDKKYIILLQNAGFNLDLPLYKIVLTNKSKLRDLTNQLQILRKLEDFGYPTNIVINYVDSAFYSYKDLKYEISKLNFFKSVIKFHYAKDVELSLLYAINIVNVNYPLGTKNIVFDAKNLGYNVRINNTVYNFFDEEYVDDTLCSKICTPNVNVFSKRTFDYIKNFEIQKFTFISTKKKQDTFDFVINIALQNQDSASCYKCINHTNYTLTIFDVLANSSTKYVSTLPIFRDINVSKSGIHCKYKIKSSPYFYIAKCYGDSVELKDYIKGEELLCQAKTNYKSLNFVKVMSSNSVINKLINVTFPHRIKLALISNPKKIYTDFKAFNDNNYILPQNLSILCHNYLKPQSMFITNKNVIKDYLSLLYIYFGICFTSKGIVFNSNKAHILSNSKLSFVYKGVNYDINICNDYKDCNVVKQGSVEFYNLKYLPFSQLNNKLVLQF